VLATIRADGRPRLVPLAFAAVASEAGGEPLLIYSALDEKPKSVADPHDLGRVRDVIADPRVTLLIDRWSEDWQRLAWLRLDGRASVLEPTDEPAGEHARAVGLLRERYPQYAGQRLERRPLLRIVVDRSVSWGLEG
jgi:PPOX class probable F420-dependent enzyme